MTPLCPRPPGFDGIVVLGGNQQRKGRDIDEGGGIQRPDTIADALEEERFARLLVAGPLCHHGIEVIIGKERLDHIRKRLPLIVF